MTSRESLVSLSSLLSLMSLSSLVSRERQDSPDSVDSLDSSDTLDVCRNSEVIVFWGERARKKEVRFEFGKLKPLIIR